MLCDQSQGHQLFVHSKTISLKYLTHYNSVIFCGHHATLLLFVELAILQVKK